jgi:hypothetical protein
VCGLVADIDFDKRTVTVQLPGDKPFPSHPECELARGVDEIDTSKLEKA